MPERVSVSVRVNVPKLHAAILEKVVAAVEKTALDGEAIAKVNAPVDTGFLRSAIKAEPTSNPLHWTITSYAEYSIFLEYGTRNMHAQPFMTPMSERLRPILQANLASAI